MVGYQIKGQLCKLPSSFNLSVKYLVLCALFSEMHLMVGLSVKKGKRGLTEHWIGDYCMAPETRLLLSSYEGTL
jgi:hypothetical protein